MKYEQKSCELHGGETIILRAPDPAEDVARLVEFFTALPDAERHALRCVVSESDPLQERLQQLDGENHFRLIAEHDGRIVGDATLDREPYNWTRHVASLRAVVAPEWVGRDINAVLLRELVILGEDAGIERLYSEVMPEHTTLINALKEAGFVHEATLEKFAKGVDGRPHDLLMMTNDLNLAWDRLAAQMLAMDLRIPG